MNQDMDNSDLYRRALVYAIEVGILHAKLGQKAVAEDALLAILRGHVGDFRCRNGHAVNLRRAYGAAYNGVKCTQRATARPA